MSLSWTDTSSASSICWAQLSTDTREDGVDFVLKVSTQFPMCISAETARALPVYTSIISNP
ncbi:hypothetical protein LCGC14_1953820 [marine sediment metagenome]|uniref:Uncharacterized protein n=1 Tax=marine sediment metagenome TaxID=412755 RepID=A0A0F9HV02_9ZZZZ